MKSKNLASNALALLALFISQSSMAEMPKNWPRMKSGFVETVATFNGKSLPAMQMCMTDAEIAEAERSADKENHCTMQKTGQTGNTYFAEMLCKSPEAGNTWQMRVEATQISANQLKSKMVSKEGDKIKFQSEQTLTRIRDCTKDEEVKTNKPKSGVMSKEEAMNTFGDMKNPENRKKLEEMMKQFKNMKKQ